MQEQKSKKPGTNFDNFWTILKKEAVRLGLGKVDWMERSGLNYQRFSEFNGDKRKRSISTKYFIKLIGGLGMSIDNAEKRLGCKFTDAQRDALRFEAKVDANKDWLEILLNDPDKVKIVKSIIYAKFKTWI